MGTIAPRCTDLTEQESDFMLKVDSATQTYNMVDDRSVEAAQLFHRRLRLTCSFCPQISTFDYVVHSDFLYVKVRL